MVEAVISFDLLSNLLAIISFLLLLLVAVFGWIGSRVHNRLDEISKSISAIEKDIREDLGHLDRRVSRMEGAVDRNTREVVAQSKE